MKRIIFAIYLLVGMYVVPTEAAGREVLVVWGDFGRAMMQPLADAIAAKGFKVTMVSHAAIAPKRKWYASVTHSAGDRKGLASGAPLVITLDATPYNQGCQRGSACINYYNPANKWSPLGFFTGLCCGGYEVRGAKNYVVPIAHIDFPRMMKTSVVRALQ